MIMMKNKHGGSSSRNKEGLHFTYFKYYIYILKAIIMIGILVTIINSVSVRASNAVV